MKIPVLSILTMALVAAGLSAQADTVKAAAHPASAGSVRSLFGIADANHDSMLSRTEVPRAWNDLRAHFDAQDRDHNHRLSEPEFNAYLMTLVSTDWSDPNQRISQRRGARDILPPLPSRQSGK